MKKITDYAELVKAKHALNKTIAPVEDGASMAGSYTSGKQFIREGVLYTALTTIAANTAWSSLTLDTDYELADDLTSQLASLNQTLTNKVANEIATRAKVSGHNLLPNYAVSLTNYTVDFTVNPGGSITADGTATGGNAQIYWNIKKRDLLSGRYILSKTTAASGDHLYLNARNGNTFVKQLAAIGGSTTESAAFDVDWDGYDNISVGWYFDQNTVVDNVTIYPMLRLATDLDTTYQPYSMTNQEMTPYVQAISNPNLLDNPWFTVNQRGVTSKTQINDEFAIDRWRVYAKNFVANANGISIERVTDYCILGQILEDAVVNKLVGKVLTMSVMFQDGTIKSGTAVFSSVTDSIIFYLANGIMLDYNYYNNVGRFRLVIYTAGTYEIRAIKLELGSVSTLAQDTAPNYATELLKCQRYFNRVKQNASISQFGIALPMSTDTIRYVYQFPVEMRTVPTVTPSDTLDFYYATNGDTTSMTNNPTTVNRQGGTTRDIGIGFIKTGAFTVGTVYAVAGKGYFDLSADL